MITAIFARTNPTVEVNVNATGGGASGNTQIIEYKPGVPSIGDTGEYKPVTDTLRFRYIGDTSTVAAKGATEGAARTMIRTLNQLFTRAKLSREQRSKRGRMLFRVKVRSTDSEYHTEVHGGLAAFAEFSGTKINQYEIVVTFIRDPYFTASTEQPLSINNLTTAVGFVNAGDNYYTLTHGSFDGDMPSPVRLEITNAFAGSASATEVFAGIHVGGNGVTHKYEAESGSVPSGATSPLQTVTGASGGASNNTRRCTVLSHPDQAGSIPVSRFKIVQWTLTPAVVALLDGRRVKPFIRLATIPPNTDIQFSINDEVNYVTATTTRYWVELPSLPIPSRPVLGDSTDDGEDVTLTLYARKMSTGNAQVDVDFVILMPVGGNRRYLTPNFPNNETLHDDPYLDNVFVRTTHSPARRRATGRAVGAPLMFYPGEAHSICILGEHASYTGWNDARTLNVKAFARPRRLNI